LTNVRYDLISYKHRVIFITQSYIAAINFKEWCDKLDLDGDKKIEVEDLCSFMSADGMKYSQK
jgi:hypothetical protein